MGISNRLRPALGRITSSIASSASYGISRVLSFTDSFNERTSLLLDDALVHDDGYAEEEDEPASLSPSSVQQAAAHLDDDTAAHAPVLILTAAVGTLDIEAAAALPATTTGGGFGQQQEPPATDPQLQQGDNEERKRVAKVVQTVCLFGASASLLLFVNPPQPQQGRRRRAMHRVNLAFVCLGLFTSLGLSMFSIVARPGEPAVAGVQKWGMLTAVASVLAASALRIAIMLPAASLESAWIVFVLLAAVVAVYLSLAWKFGGGRLLEASSNSPDDTVPV